MTTHLKLGEDYRELKKWKYETLAEMRCDLDWYLTGDICSEYVKIIDGQLIIKTGYAWDGASFIARDTPNFMRASLFHDSLCQLIGEGLLGKEWRKKADQLLRIHCLEDGMSKFRAWYVYRAVRIYSWSRGM